MHFFLQIKLKSSFPLQLYIRHLQLAWIMCLLGFETGSKADTVSWIKNTVVNSKGRRCSSWKWGQCSRQCLLERSLSMHEQQQNHSCPLTILCMPSFSHSYEDSVNMVLVCLICSWHSSAVKWTLVRSRQGRRCNVIEVSWTSDKGEGRWPNHQVPSHTPCLMVILT